MVRFADREAQENSDWDIIGSVEAWEDVIAGKQNLSVAFRSGQLRYCDRDESGPMTAGSRQSLTRIRVLADLLGLTDW
jgi:putative sterol carrier protein